MFFKYICLLSITYFSILLAQQEAIFPNPNPDNIGECVYSYQCSSDGFIITNGSEIVGPRVDLNIKHIPIPCPCTNISFVCCKNSQTTTAIKINTSTSLIPTSEPPTGPLVEPTTGPSTESPTETPIKMELPIKHCGEQRNIFGPRILSTDDSNHVVQTGDYPWTLAIFNMTSSDITKLDFLGGASLLGPRVALTVSHNFPMYPKPETYVVRAGEFNLSHTKELVKHQDRVLTHIIKHPQYVRNGFLYDIALLIWDEPLDMTYINTNSICLPEKDDNFEDLECYVTGWGTSLASSSRTSDQLKFVDLTVVGKAECEAKYKSILGNGFQLHETQICAGGVTGKDTCKGDGGSPLVCKPDNERYYKLAGVVSWGIGCGEKRPSIYSNIANTIEWIRKTINNASVEVF